ncbi:MAG: hypothetical protein ACTSVI_02380 [Promethearchaeota archaeon]
MLQSFYIFNKSGYLIFHYEIKKNTIDPKLISAFLSSINSWAQMYSNTGLSLFQTGKVRFMFERSIYSKDLIFCIAASVDHDEEDLKNKIHLIRESFVHFFWEDRSALEKGILQTNKIENFKETIKDLLQS